METAARIVQDKLLPLKVIVKVVRKLAIGRALETNADDKKQTNCSVCSLPFIFSHNFTCTL